MALNFKDSTLTVALVGVGGFVGSHLLREILVRTSWRVFGVDLELYRIQEFLNHERCEFLVGDLADSSVVERIVQADIVVNLAAICLPSRYMEESSFVIESNFNYPMILAKACENAGKWLIHFSTSEIYGRTSDDFCELKEDETPLILGPVSATRWSYATAKILMERYLAGIKKLRWTVVRPFNFIGSHMDFMPGVDGEGIPRVLANFSSALIKNKPLKLVNDGIAKRSFTSIYDAINFMFALFENPENSYGEAFNVGNKNNEISIKDLAQKMRTIYAELKNIPLKSIPEPQKVEGVDYYGKGYEDSLRRIPSTLKAKKLLNFEAKTDLDTALKNSLEWFIAHYDLQIKCQNESECCKEGEHGE